MVIYLVFRGSVEWLPEDWLENVGKFLYYMIVFSGCFCDGETVGAVGGRIRVEVQGVALSGVLWKVSRFSSLRLATSTSKP